VLSPFDGTEIEEGRTISYKIGVNLYIEKLSVTGKRKKKKWGRSGEKEILYLLLEEFLQFEKFEIPATEQTLSKGEACLNH